MKPHANLRNQDHLVRTLEFFNGPRLSNKSEDLILQILNEMFLRPFAPSKELSSRFGISKDDLRTLYSSIRSSEKVRYSFWFSPYHYLIEVLRHLSEDGERTSTIINGGTPSPLSETMELFISQKCNAKCKFCYRNGKTYDDREVLSGQEYESLINEFADLHGKNLDISGGLEPLLSPSILDVLKAGIDRSLNVSLYTNGIALNNPEVMSRLMKIHKIRVSLNAYDMKSYKEAMGVDRFDLVIDNIRNLVKSKRDNKSNVKIGISYVVIKENYAHILQAIKLAQELGVDFLDLRSVEVTDVGDFDEEQRRKLRPVLMQIRKADSCVAHGKLSVSIADTLNTIADSSNDFSRYFNENFVNALPYFRVTVTPQGEVYALNLIGQPSREDKRYLLGEISKHKGLSEMLTNKNIVPFEQGFLLTHDITLISALSKLEADSKFGISLDENPFNWVK